MKTIGFMISTKKGEKRRALLPKHIPLIENKDMLYFEKGYGLGLGHSDEEYLLAGANVGLKHEILKKDVICDPKIGDATYLAELTKGQIVFGWVHAVQNKSITDVLLNNKVSVLAWEDMYENNRHIFWKNNELAGEASIMHALTLFGKAASECKVAILGKGNTARGAYKTFTSLGAQVIVYDRKTEKLLRKECGEYDIIVNCILWDVYRDDHILYKEDLLRMKKPSMIIDISCDRAGGIETSVPTRFDDPVYLVDGVMHYTVDNTPSIFNYSATESIGDELVNFLDAIIENRIDEDVTLDEALIIKEGIILDKRIIDFQNR